MQLTNKATVVQTPSPALSETEKQPVLPTEQPDSPLSGTQLWAWHMVDVLTLLQLAGAILKFCNITHGI